VYTLYGRSNRDGRCGNTVGQQGGSSDGGKHISPSEFLSDKGVERQNATFSFVVGSEGDDNVFERGLKSQCPDYARYGSDNSIGSRHVETAHNSAHYVEWGGADVTIDDAHRNNQTDGTERYFLCFVCHVFFPNKGTLIYTKL